MLYSLHWFEHQRVGWAGFGRTQRSHKHRFECAIQVIWIIENQMSLASLLVWICMTGSFSISLELVLDCEIETDFLLLNQTVVPHMVVRVCVQTKFASTLILFLFIIVGLSTIALLIFISRVSHHCFIYMDRVLKSTISLLLLLLSTKFAQLKSNIMVLVIVFGG